MKDFVDLTSGFAENSGVDFVKDKIAKGEYGYPLGVDASVNIKSNEEKKTSSFLGSGYSDEELENCAIEGGTFARDFINEVRSEDLTRKSTTHRKPQTGKFDL